MKTHLRLPIVLQLLGTMAACGELVGIGDVPTPADGGADATPPADSRESSDGGGHDSAGPSSDGPSDAGASGEGPSGEGSSGEGSSATVDGAVDSTTPDGGAVEAGTDAAIDAATCTATWDTYDPPSCNACGIMRCCGELTTCEIVDEAGLDRGMSRCAALVYCIAGYSGTPPPMTGDRLCKMDDQYTPTELANEDAALSCIRANCSVECAGL